MRVFSNLAISLDGKIADPAHPDRPLGTPQDRKTMQVIRRQADVVIVGAQTLRVSKKAIHSGGKRELVNAVVTRSGRLDAQLPFWKDERTLRFVFTSAEGRETALRAARDRAFVVAVGKKDRIDPVRILERLEQSGLNNVLVEGGGELMALFLKARLLGELYVTLTPWILGGQRSPTLVGGESPLAPWARLELLKSRRVQQEMYLHYRVRGARHV